MASNATQKSVSHHENLRDSGVEWIGMVPKSWLQAKLKRIITARDGGSWGDDPKGNSEDMICLRVADFDFSVGCFKEQSVEKFTVRNYTQAIIDRLYLEKGDILIEKSGGGALTPVGRSVIFDKNFPALYANFLERIRVDKNKILPEFAEYWFRSMYYSGITSAYIKQTTGIQNLDITSLLSSEYIVFPDIIFQRTIVSFLNKNEALLNQFIGDVKDSIKEYQAWKSSIIYEAVTKGLDPSVEMKDSGVAWIGKIPYHWTVTKIGNFVSIRSGITLGKRYTSEKTLVARPYLRVANVKADRLALDDVATIMVTPEEAKKYELVPGELLMTEGGDRDKLGRGTIWNGEIPGCLHQNHVFAVHVNEKYMLTKYLDYLTTSPVGREYFDLTAKKTTNLASTNSSTILRFTVPVPPISEQRDIVAMLDTKCKILDEIIQEKEALVRDLDAYKKSLIYEVVTGKRKIC